MQLPSPRAGKWSLPQLFHNALSFANRDARSSLLRRWTEPQKGPQAAETEDPLWMQKTELTFQKPSSEPRSKAMTVSGHNFLWRGTCS